MPTALIAEDEQLLRRHLRQSLCDAWPQLDIVGEAEDGEQALELFEKLKPDIVFLDIRMPRLNGLEVAKTIAGRATVVFITAHDEYAVAAFEEGAVDYLLKPIAAERVAKLVGRLKTLSTVSAGATREAAQTLLKAVNRALNRDPDAKWIRASIGKTTRMIATADVLYFKSDGKYTLVRTMSGEALIRKTIQDLLMELDPAAFWQIHRGTIVRVDVIDRIERDGTQTGTLWLKPLPNSPLVVSRAFMHLFRSH
jgi:DNA-binding LytR/AlgR family response regulator